ncbi:MAG TPA: hypothetical protein VK889_03500, partial [Solirubrobacterales bacterium]|nr:hypothetical protein [Solirubrobacterales bacterium]
MSSRRLATIALPLLAACLAAFAGPAVAATPPAPLDLRVAGGEGWQPDNDFRFDWHNPNPVAWATVDYRVSDLAGTVVLDSSLPWDADRVEDIHEPRPGRYRVEVWFESAAGEPGPSVTAGFRFDDVPPAAIGLSLPTGWIGGDKQPLLRLSRPAEPHPLSGIRGYAVVAGSVPSHPCAAGVRCAETETDLAADGVGDDLMPLADLPEGTVHVRAAAVSGARVAGPLAGGTLRVDRTPPAIDLGGMPAGWVSRPVTVRARAADALSGMAGAGALTGIAARGTTPSVAAGDAVSLTVSGEGAHLVSAYARDVAGNSSPLATAAVRIDRTPPRVAFAALDPADPELLSARVTDELSGPDPARGSVGVRPRGSRRQFALLPTAVADGRLIARWDSDRHPPGLYEFQATAFDAAGNTAESQLRADGAKLVLPAPLKMATRLTAGLGPRRLPARTVPFGKRVLLGGALSRTVGAPLAGLPLLVTEHFADGSTPRRHQLRSGPDGSFALRLSPGPERRIELGFAGTRTLAATSAPPLELKVRTGVSMRASAASARIGGRPLVFRGTVAGKAAVPAKGKSVELQYRLPGLPWTQFRTVRTDPRGRFRYPYRFSDDDSRGVRFGFRAFVPAEPGWPYEPAASRPVFVTGR